MRRRSRADARAMLAANMRVLLVTPPMTQLNTPYPATAYLTGFLRKHAAGVEVAQADSALELFLRLFSATGLEQVPARSARARQAGSAGGPRRWPTSWRRPRRYLATVDPVVRFLQGRDPSLAMRIVGPRASCPRGRASPPPSGQDGEGDRGLDWAFGGAGHHRSRQVPGQPVHRRSGGRDPRRHRPPLRAVPLRREAGRERGHLRRPAPGAGGASPPWSTRRWTTSPRELLRAPRARTWWG